MPASCRIAEGTVSGCLIPAKQGLTMSRKPNEWSRSFVGLIILLAEIVLNVGLLAFVLACGFRNWPIILAWFVATVIGSRLAERAVMKRLS